MVKSTRDNKTLEMWRCERLLKNPFCENVKIESGDLTENSFADLSLDGSVFEGVVLNQVTVSDFKIVESCLNKCSLAGAEIEQSYFLKTEFISSRLQGIQLPQSRMNTVTFSTSKLNDANLRYAKFKNVVFDSCDMSGVDFIGAELKDVSFKNCNLTGANFSQTVLKKVDLASCDISDIIIDAESVKEVFVDTGQALYLSSIFGLKIRD